MIERIAAFERMSPRDRNGVLGGLFAVTPDWDAVHAQPGPDGTIPHAEYNAALSRYYARRESETARRLPEEMRLLLSHSHASPECNLYLLYDYQDRVESGLSRAEGGLPTYQRIFMCNDPMKGGLFDAQDARVVEVDYYTLIMNRALEAKQFLDRYRIGGGSSSATDILKEEAWQEMEDENPFKQSLLRKARVEELLRTWRASLIDRKLLTQ